MFFDLFKPKSYGPEDLERDLKWAYGGGETYAGMAVSEESALSVAAVFGCVRVLAEDVAKIPLIFYRRIERGRERAPDHRLYDLLHNRPNEYQTSAEWREMMQGHAALRGNAYSLISRDSMGRVLELLPLHPDRCEPKMSTKLELTYEVTFADGSTTNLKKENIFHLRGMSTNGYSGLSVIGRARQAVGLASATERYGAQLFKNGARPGGVLKHPHKFSSKEVAERVRDSWDQATSGSNAHRTAVLEEGMEWTQIGMTSEDAQFLETRKFQMVDICRFFRVPPYKIYADMEKAKGWSTLEQQTRDYLNDSLLPWLVKWEQAISTRLLTQTERAIYYPEFLFEGLLRADTKSRQEALQIQRRNGIINANEWRQIENMNPRTDPGGDEYIYEKNMTTGDDDAKSNDATQQ